MVDPEVLPGFVTRGPVVGEQEVAAFEARCGFRLPPDYRQFLLDQNGGDFRIAQPAQRRDRAGLEIVRRLGREEAGEEVDILGLVVHAPP